MFAEWLADGKETGWDAVMLLQARDAHDSDKLVVKTETSRLVEEIHFEDHQKNLQ